MGTNTEGIQAATKSPVISVGQYSYRSALYGDPPELPLRGLGGDIKVQTTAPTTTLQLSAVP
jgi:hypothetical protein